MIRVNLLREFQDIPRQSVALPKPSPSLPWKPVLLVAGLLVLAAGAYLWFSTSGGPAPLSVDLPLKEENVPTETKALEPPREESGGPQVVYSDAVEEVVREIEAETGHKGGPTYANLSPDLKIAYQLATCWKALSYLKKVSSSDIGFTELTLSLPGKLYLHGKASNQKQFEAFERKLRGATFASLKPGMVKPFGHQNVGREFTFYGNLKFSTPGKGSGRVVREKELSGVLKEFEGSARSSGISLSPLVLKSNTPDGGLSKRVYKVQADNCNFFQFNKWVQGLAANHSPVGFEKMALQAGGGENLFVNMDAVVFVKP